MSIIETMAIAIYEDQDGTLGAFADVHYDIQCQYFDMAHAALRAIKPEDISDGMVEAYLRAHGGSDESVKKALFMGVNDFRRAIAAAIAAGAEQ